jgi:hypothetical protein
VFIDAPTNGQHSLCLGMNAARKVVLQKCGIRGNSYLISSEWIQDTGVENGWRNFNWGPNGDLAVTAAKAKDPLFGIDARNACSTGDCWYRWSD